MGFRRLTFLLSVTFALSLAACGDNKHPVFEDAGTDTVDIDGSVDAPPDALMCPTGQTKCGTPPACVDTKTDEDNCGTCGNDCGTGTCITHNNTSVCCPSGQTNCNGACVDLTVNVDNCGQCGTDCGTGTCQTTGTSTICCPTGQTNCAGTCVDLLTNEANCGACAGAATAEVCSGATDTCCGGNCVNTDIDDANCQNCGTACTGGTPDCTPSSTTGGSVCCPVGQTNCGGSCVNAVVSNTNCGGCGITCDVGNNDSCQATDTGSTTGGPRCCDNTENNCNGQCSNPMTDNANCGGCGLACGGSDTCTSGKCCGPGEINCGGVCVNPDTNPDHCGGCGGTTGTDCPSGAPNCSDGTCVTACDNSETLCSGACVDVGSDPNNCGTCATVCPTNQVCADGVCSTSCAAGEILCDGACVDVMTDENHCGSCSGTGSLCDPTATCDGGLCCAAGSVKNGTICCPVGFLNCNGVCADPLADTTCNGCGTSNNCTLTNGTCTTGTDGGTFCCPAGTSRCGSQCVDLTQSEANCGTCNTACASGETCTDKPVGVTGGPECCSSTEINCGGTDCVDKLENDVNCGSCGNNCTTNSEQCSNGECCPVNFTNYIVGANSICCGPGLTSCDGTTCISLNDNNSCGTTCANKTVCSGGTVCNGGSCVTNCGTLTNCSDSCVNLASDPSNCGACDNVCPASGQLCTDPDSNGLGTCQPCAQIGPNPDPANGCGGVCVDIDENNLHCGGCSITGTDRSCDVNEDCTEGLCCPTGQTNCNGTCVDLSSDEANCGACVGDPGHDACTGTGETCQNGDCSCGFGSISCTNGCVTPSVDPLNCGTCGNQCGTGPNNAGLPYCVSNGCVATCPLPLFGCGTGATAECVNRSSDDDNCGSCGNKCVAGASCVNGSCTNDKFTFTPLAKCVGGGPPIVVPTGPGEQTCTGNLGAVSFTFGLCSRTNMGPLSQAMFQDAFNSTQGPYRASCTTDANCGAGGDCVGGTCIGGGVGINGTVAPVASGSKGFHVGGDFWVMGSFGLNSAITLNVKRDFYNKDNDFSVSGNNRVWNRAFIGGTNIATDNGTNIFEVTGPGSMRIDNTLTTYASACTTALADADFMLNGTPKCTVSDWDTARRDPCGTAADLVPIRSIVEHFRNPVNNDNDEAGVPYNAMSPISGATRIDLACGYYYFDAIQGSGNLNLHVTGRTAIFIGGTADINVEMVIDLEPNATLDIFVGGVIRISQPITIGSPAFPRLTRLWIGSALSGMGSCTHPSDCASGQCSACPYITPLPNDGHEVYGACSGTGICEGSGTGRGQAIDMSQGGFFNGLLYAGVGAFSSSSAVEIYGSVFANYLDFSGALTVHYDQGAVKTGDECPPIPPSSACESCRDCGNQPCIGNQCGSMCTKDSDCCPPFTCNTGTGVCVP